MAHRTGLRVTITRDEFQMLRNPAVLAALEEFYKWRPVHLATPPAPRRKKT